MQRDATARNADATGAEERAAPLRDSGVQPVAEPIGLASEPPELDPDRPPREEATAHATRKTETPGEATIEATTERERRKDVSRNATRNATREATPDATADATLPMHHSLRNATADGAGGLAVTNWCAGIRSVNKAAIVVTPRGSELEKLVEALHKVEPDPAKRTQAAFDDAAAYARARKGEKISVHGYCDWLAGERAERTGVMRKAVPVQPPSRAWKMAVPNGGSKAS